MKNQYAYTEELSTTDALVKFSSDTSAGLNKTDTVTLQALLLDFSKAFDRMRPDIAVSKLLSRGSTHPKLNFKSSHLRAQSSHLILTAATT